ncbi:GNAT family N-acetyltransferase [Cellulomonas fengjieae]|uniref:N-acetyltransferase n=1 Tax=Cellulomonas fengjieae TaxID=2819978 RepID=A0ABS3SHI6_9CELL|nr:GNAT family N-acetyltransferase [Cellulomonas fengjieae]MBO3085213.1 N-acetyltransferase [Cellulomonas fengjieae]MBO3100955.1 N-acetyltransferase [Cellulomonas fengjieae]QVI66220.1 N-acetyltransferase [Cellulomonas fengjieae]
MTDVRVTDATDEHRFEARSPDGVLLGFTVYDTIGATVVFTHTEVDPALEGQGIASMLVKAALDAVRASGRDVVAFCPYVKAWLGRHPDYQDLLRTAQG